MSYGQRAGAADVSPFAIHRPKRAEEVEGALKPLTVTYLLMT